MSVRPTTSSAASRSSPWTTELIAFTGGRSSRITPTLPSTCTCTNVLILIRILRQSLGGCRAMVVDGGVVGRRWSRDDGVIGVLYVACCPRYLGGNVVTCGGIWNVQHQRLTLAAAPAQRGGTRPAAE